MPDSPAITARSSSGDAHATASTAPAASTTATLTAYAACRDQLCPRPATASFFLSGGGTRLNHTNTSTTFVGLLEAAGITTPPGRRRPRLYDLRHGFAVRGDLLELIIAEK